MDTMGDADEIDDGDQPPARLGLTPEARVLTGVGLILAGLFSNGIFQAASFFILRSDGSNSRWAQWSLFAGPTAVLSLAAAVLVMPLTRQPTSRMLHGAAVAVAVVGVVLVIAIGLGFVLIATTDETSTF